MDFLNQIVHTPETQVLLPFLLVIHPMLKTIPGLPKWSYQWIDLILGILLSILLSGFNFDAVATGVMVSMMATYVSVGYSSKKVATTLATQQKLIDGLKKRVAFTGTSEVPPSTLKRWERFLKSPPAVTKIPTEEELYTQLAEHIKRQILTDVSVCESCHLKIAAYSIIAQEEMSTPPPSPTSNLDLPDFSISQDASIDNQHLVDSVSNESISSDEIAKPFVSSDDFATTTDPTQSSTPELNDSTTPSTLTSNQHAIIEGMSSLNNHSRESD